MQQLAAFAFSLWLKAAPRGGMGISALLLRSIFSLIYGRAAGLRPLPTAVQNSRDSQH